MTDDGRAVVDAHIHQWDPFTTPRVVSGIAKIVRRAPFLLPALARIFPRSSREFVGDPRYLLNAYLPGDYRARRLADSRRHRRAHRSGVEDEDTDRLRGRDALGRARCWETASTKLGNRM